MKRGKEKYTAEEVKNFGLWLGEYFKKQSFFHILIRKPRTIDSLFNEWNSL